MSVVATRLTTGLFTAAIVGTTVATLFGGAGALMSHSMQPKGAAAADDVAVLEVWAEPRPAQPPAAGAHSLMLNALANGAGRVVYAAGAQRGAHGYGTGVDTDGGLDEYHAVLVAYGEDGEAQWARTVSGASGGASFRSLATAADGTVYAAGWMRADGPTDLEPGVTLEAATSGTTAMLVAYGSDGTTRWAASPWWERWDPWGWSLGRSTTGRARAEQAARSVFHSVAVDGAGSVYAAGAQSGTDFYRYGENVGARATGRGANAVLVKYDSAGNAQWARTIGSGGGSSEFLSAAVDDSGYVYAAGYQHGTGALSYGAGVIGRGGSARTNAVLVKYAPDGAAEWVRIATGSDGASRFESVAVDSEGSVYAAGSQTGAGSLIYGAGLRVAGSSVGENPVLVAFSPDGSARWGRTSGSAAVTASFHGVAVGEDGMVYVAGSQSGTEELDYGDGVRVAGGSRLGNPVLVMYTADGIAARAATAEAKRHGRTFAALAADRQGGVLTVAVQYNTVYDYSFADEGATASNATRTYSSKVMAVGEEHREVLRRIVAD